VISKKAASSKHACIPRIFSHSLKESSTSFFEKQIIDNIKYYRTTLA
jgi:hypothetical protein